MTEKPATGLGYKVLDDGNYDDADHSACLDYWNKVRGDRLAPPWKEFKLVGLGPSLIPFITVVDVHEDPLDFVYRFWGTAHVDLKHAEFTGKSVLAHRPVELGEMVFAEYERVLRTRAPVRIIDNFTMDSRGIQLTQLIIRMPLSDDGERISHIVSYCDFRNDWEAWQKFFDERRAPLGSTGSRGPID